MGVVPEHKGERLICLSVHKERTNVLSITDLSLRNFIYSVLILCLRKYGMRKGKMRFNFKVKLRVKAFENEVTRKIFGSVTKKVTEAWRICLDEELHTSHGSRVLNSMSGRWRACSTRGRYEREMRT
jgi:hypothetical protein